MVRRMTGLLLLLAAGTAAWAQEKPAAPPAQQYDALLKEYKEAQDAFSQAYREAKTEEDREKVFKEKYPQPDKYAARFLELAEKNSKEPFAADALVWVVNHGRGAKPGKDDPRSRALELLGRDHIASPKLDRAVQSLAYSSDMASEALLRTALEKSPHREVQAWACLNLARFLKQRAEWVGELKGKPERALRAENYLGKEAVAVLKKLEPAKVTAEAEQLFERTATQYGDLKHPWRKTFREAAETNLFEIRHLAIGKLAPDIEGEDQDGKRFKLSDYRGKVVVLDFWGNW